MHALSSDCKLDNLYSVQSLGSGICSPVISESIYIHVLLIHTPLASHTCTVVDDQHDHIQCTVDLYIHEQYVGVSASAHLCTPAQCVQMKAPQLVLAQLGSGWLQSAHSRFSSRSSSACSLARGPSVSIAGLKVAL